MNSGWWMLQNLGQENSEVMEYLTGQKPEKLVCVKLGAAEISTRKMKEWLQMNRR